MVPNPIMETQPNQDLLIPILFVSNDSMILKIIINNPPIKSSDAEIIANCRLHLE